MHVDGLCDHFHQESSMELMWRPFCAPAFTGLATFTSCVLEASPIKKCTYPDTGVL